MRGMAKILIIDDIPGLRRTVHGMLQRGGHEVLEAGDGSEGVRLFEAGHPDLVITDLVMPGKEGIETILDLRRRNPKLPILAISGDPESKTYLELARKLGANAVLEKPFRAADLLNEIDKLLKLSKGG
jgi:CheY-like chemotaxis protein